MANSRDELKEIVGELRQELSNINDLDPARQQKVDRLSARLDELTRLDVTGEQEAAAGEATQFEDEGTLAESLSDAVTGFEASHPKLTQLVDRVLHLLSSIGI